MAYTVVSFCVRCFKANSFVILPVFDQLKHLLDRPCSGKLKFRRSGLVDGFQQAGNNGLGADL